MSIVILSNPEDYHALLVAEAIRRRGAEATLWHTPDFPSLACETIAVDRNGIGVRVRGPELDLGSSRPRVVWYRRPGVLLDRSALHPADYEFARRQCQYLRAAVFELFAEDAFWVNPVAQATRADLKPVQQRAAISVGLEVPPTLYSNDPDEIRSFMRAHGGSVVFKSLTQDSVWREGDFEHSCFTAKLDEHDLAEDSLLRNCPGIFQALVPKAHELRVTIMGETVFATELDSQATEEGQLDYRLAFDEMRCEPAQLPASLEEACVELMRALGLVHGSLDLVVTPDGRVVFLEVNESGQFLWVEYEAGQPLLDAFTDFLIQGRSDFRWKPTSKALSVHDFDGDALRAASLGHATLPSVVHVLEEE